MFRRNRHLIWVPFSVVFLLAATLSIVSAFPPNSMPFLTYKGTGNDTEAGEYYSNLDLTLGPASTLNQWKSLYGFSGVNDVRAVYYNAGDLGFGREMHCRKNVADVACYVINHGHGAGGPPEQSASAAANNQLNLPTVAMVYKAVLNGQPNDVAFYIFDPAGNRINKVALDGEGDKYVPYLCLPCHGGNYDPTANSVTDASFLPFDAPSFRYSAQAGYNLSDQQEAFRQLNSLVRDTNPTALITELIDGWYANTGGVNTPGSTLDDSFVASGYSGDPGLYNNVVKHYCRACHTAQSFNLATPAGVSSAQYAVFTGFYMPHAQLTNHNFWNSPAPAYLANNQGWSLRVTKTADTNDGACDADCSLREAILDANAFADKSIITFDVNGAFELSLGGADDTAALGDLDITQPLILLGNGASNTIISGNSIDRVFHILGATTNVVIQGVTIQDGNTSGYGGGILNDSSTLALNNSVVRNNTSSSSGGGGLASLGSAQTEVNNSAIGPGNTTGVGGGGVYNDSQLILSNSTVSGNSAIAGGGLYSLSSGKVITVTQSTITGNTGTNGGGGIRNFQSTGFLQNSIVAGNSGGGGGPDCLNANAMTSLGYNLVGQNGSANGCPTVGTDIVVAGTIETVLNTNLTGEQGSVTYHALIPGSPAIDAIPLGANCTLPSYDQRNLARPLDGNTDNTAACDIGAREFNQVSVTSRFDIVANDGQCTLREAVSAANTGLPSGTVGGECAGSPDVIHLAVAGPYDLTQGQLTVLGAVTINGNGQTIRRTSGTTRIFEVTSGGNLNLTNVTVRDGAQAGVYYLDTSSGGGIFINSGGVANIVNSAIINNSSTSWGGGIANLGTLNIANSTVAGNNANVDSGGINNRGVANLINVTVSENTADADADDFGDGGGVGAFGGTTTIKNSLIARNFDTPGNIGASTHLSAEEAAAAAQAGQGQPADVGAQATANADVYVLVAGFLTSGDYNLIGNDTGSNGAFSGAHDQVGTTGNLLNPKLGPLTGSPAYYPLQPDSPAIDQIPAVSCVFISNLGNPLFRANSAMTTDQRGVTRPVNPTCDIGSYESLNFVFLPLILK